MQKIFFLFTIIISTIAVHAQSKPSYTAIIEAGVLKGGSDNSNTILFTNGIRYKNAMGGVGVGIDNYLFRSIPLFVRVRKSFGNHLLQPFISASAGINISHPTNGQKSSYFFSDSARVKNGFMADVSTGVSVKIYKQLRGFISAGFSYKTTKVIYKNGDYTPNEPTEPGTDIYRMNRWCISGGLWF